MTNAPEHHATSTRSKRRMVVFLAAASIAVACGVRFTSAGALLWGLALLLMAAAATRKRTPSGMTAAALILLGLSFAGLAYAHPVQAGRVIL
ncbi:MAG: hypothetical protein IPM06_03410 [Rhizobiales bacterium]|nr:hypothetical protein [Hyphomicrobiales bacterium]